MRGLQRSSLLGAVMLAGIAAAALCFAAAQDEDAVPATEGSPRAAVAAPTDAPAPDADAVDQTSPPSAAASAEPSTSDAESADAAVPGADVEQQFSRDIEALIEQIAEQRALLETAQTGEERVKIETRIQFLEQELRSLQRALQ